MTLMDKRGRNFVKMHGLGNDFVIFDARNDGLPMSGREARQIADRRRGIGCDQVIVMERAEKADVRMVTFNSDGSQSDACGNAARCIARLLMDSGEGDSVRIAAGDRILNCARLGDGEIAVDMGKPLFDWRDIPLAEERDTDRILFDSTGLPPGMAVNVGNPHIVFFMDDLSEIAVGRLGAEIETDPLFPERVNVTFAVIDGPDAMRVKVWERGADETGACGTAAAAAFTTARRASRVGERAAVRLDGGTLRLETTDGDGIRLIGPASYVFTGRVDMAALDQAESTA